MPRPVSTLAITLVAAVASAQPPAVPVRSALEPASTGGIEVVDRALAKLSTHARLLVIGAHPDDEDTSLLTLVSRGLGGEAAYLALSRGDGGQNLIGAELGEGLGLIRTQELLAARRIDGAHQYFTRAFDFGYTRSLEETLRRWPRDVLLEDVTRVVRRFRPQVIVAMFTPEIGGHGQHLASGWAAQEVMKVAGDPARFPELSEEGLSPWQPTALYRRTWFDPDSASFLQDMSHVEGLTGRSILQIAMASRSQHRSQDMGMLQPMGSLGAGLERLMAPEHTDRLFAGVDTRLSAIANGLPEVAGTASAGGELWDAGALAEEARAALSPMRPDSAIDHLARIIEKLRRARSAVREFDTNETMVAAELISEKIDIAEAGLLAAAGVGLDAASDCEAVAPGGSCEVVTSVWNSGRQEAELLGVAIIADEAWVVESREIETPNRLGVEERGFTARVSDDASPSVPYFLARSRVGDLYDWNDVPARLRGLPYQPPELEARFRLRLAGVEVEVEREVVSRRRDQAIGEVRRPVRIVPRVEVSIEPALALWDLDDHEPRTIAVTVRSHVDTPVDGSIVARGEGAFRVETVPFAITTPHGAVTVEARLTRPPDIMAGRHAVSLAAEVAGREYAGSVPVLEYPHIRPTPMPVPAALEISAFDLSLPEVGPVGYVRGASDRVPELLERVGLEVELLGPEDLATGNLSRFGVIVIGSRAYETDPALVAANERLLDFVRSGGRLVVQYQQYQFVRGGFAPYELDIARPHDRITDETAPVRLLEPRHPIFNAPNRLTAMDWDGWVQERGLYFAHSWGDEMVPLLAISDPGMEEQLGGLLMGRLGEGVYVYTGLAFFRQLPAGVAGGYRLLANLLAVE